MRHAVSLDKFINVKLFWAYCEHLHLTFLIDHNLEMKKARKQGSILQ